MKPEHRKLLDARAQAALADLYHNATPRYPREFYGRTGDYFNEWFNDAAEFEINYIASGGAYGSNYGETLRAECNAGRYKSQAARDYYVRHGMRAMQLERAQYARWEQITEYGNLYQWGRGGRTLAPKDLIRQGGGGAFSIREGYAEELCPASCTELVLILESFNRYVGAWCAGVPELWREHCETEDAEERAQKRRRATAKGRETRERRYWEAREVVTI